MMRVKTRRLGRPTLDEASALMDKILDRTLQALCNHGSEGLSIDDLVQDIGVTKRTIYRHFDNKAGLIDAVVTRELARLKHDAVHDEIPATSPLASLQNWSRHFFLYLNQPQTQAFSNYLQFESLRNPGLALRASSWHNVVVEHVTALIVAAQNDGGICQMDPHRVVLILLDLLSGAATRSRFQLEHEAVFGNETPEQFFVGRWAAFMRLVSPDPWASFLAEAASVTRND